MAIEFGDGAEPWAVSRGQVRHWVHCVVRDVSELPQAQQNELRSWLDARVTAQPVERLLVSRDDNGGYTLHAAGGWINLDLADLPVWLQHPEQPKPVKATKVRK